VTARPLSLVLPGPSRAAVAPTGRTAHHASPTTGVAHLAASADGHLAFGIAIGAGGVLAVVVLAVIAHLLVARTTRHLPWRRPATPPESATAPGWDPTILQVHHVDSETLPPEAAFAAPLFQDAADALATFSATGDFYAYQGARPGTADPRDRRKGRTEAGRRHIGAGGGGSRR